MMTTDDKIQVLMLRVSQLENDLFNSKIRIMDLEVEQEIYRNLIHHLDAEIERLKTKDYVAMDIHSNFKTPSHIGEEVVHKNEIPNRDQEIDNSWPRHSNTFDCQDYACSEGILGCDIIHDDVVEPEQIESKCDRMKCCHKPDCPLDK